MNNDAFFSISYYEVNGKLKLISACILLIFCSCSKDSENRILEPPFDVSSDQCDSEVIYYMEDAGVFLKQTDYPVNNIISKAGNGETDTFYATRFYPKSVEEQLFLGNLKDVAVSYIPWDYDPIPIEVASRINKNNVKCFQEEKSSPYYIESIIEGDTTRLHLPVMYAIWPEDLAFPEIEHEVVEKIEKQRGNQQPSYRYTLKFRTYDSLLRTFVPLKNIKVHFKLGSFSVYMTTNSQGTIQITPTNYVNAPSNINDIAVYVLPETPKFIVARDNDSGSSLL